MYGPRSQPGSGFETICGSWPKVVGIFQEEDFRILLVECTSCCISLPWYVYCTVLLISLTSIGSHVNAKAGRKHKQIRVEGQSNILVASPCANVLKN